MAGTAVIDDRGDPVLRRRETMRRIASAGRAVGYALVVVAVAVFAVGAATGFTTTITTVVTASLALTTVVLAPAIVLGYAVRAAEREENDPGRR